MQNLTAGEKNLSALECDFCVHSLVFCSTMLPYILISLPANGLVLWLMKSSPVFWTDRMEVSGFHIVITEILFGFLGSAFMITSFYSNTAVSSVVFNLISIITTARTLFQCSVCVEQYFAVVHPVLYLRYKPLRYKMSFCCVIWLQTILISVVQIFFCTDDPISVGLYVMSFSSVFIVNSFCCLSILKALKQPSPGEGEREGSIMIKKRAFNIVLMFLVTTFISYVPLITMHFLNGKVDRDTLCISLTLAYSLTVWLGAIYPLLYLHRAGKTPSNRLCYC